MQANAERVRPPAVSSVTLLLKYLVPMLYFGITPVTAINQLKWGPVSVLNALGGASICALLVLINNKRLLFEPLWLKVSAGFFLVYLFGLARADAVALPTVFANLMRFTLPWAVLSLMPPERKIIRHLMACWLIGLCAAGFFQMYGESQAPVIVDEVYGNSLSRYVQANSDFTLAVKLNIYTTHGYMAIAIAAVCTVGVAILRKNLHTRLLLLGVAGFLVISERRGGFIAADILVVAGVVMLVGLPLRFSVVPRANAGLLVSGSLLVLIYFGASYLSVENVETRASKIFSQGWMTDESAAIRAEVFLRSLETWLSNPIFGIGLVGWTEMSYERLGLHSSVVDVPAQLGLLGCIMYFSLLLSPMFVGWRVLKFAGRAPSQIVIVEDGLMMVVGSSLVALAAILNPIFMMTLMNETILMNLALAATYSNLRPLPASRRLNAPRLQHIPAS